MNIRLPLCAGAAATALVCASAGAALASTGAGRASTGAALASTSGYKVTKISVPKSVKPAPVGSSREFKITIKGSAKAKSSLWIFLAHQRCQSTQSKEAKRDGAYQVGYSYFTGPSSVGELSAKGSFTKHLSAHPGSKTGQRYVCAYLTTNGPKPKTEAYNSATYKVAK